MGSREGMCGRDLVNAGGLIPPPLTPPLSSAVLASSICSGVIGTNLAPFAIFTSLSRTKVENGSSAGFSAIASSFSAI